MAQVARVIRVVDVRMVTEQIMAKGLYAVRDFESGSVICAYETEDEVLALVRGQLDAHGPEPVCCRGSRCEGWGRLLTPVAER